METPRQRPFNFSAGPSCLPCACLEAISGEFTNWQGTGFSVVEQSHRSPTWESKMDEVHTRLRALLSIPDSFTILFMAGGGSLQFSAVPFNLLGDAATVDYFVTGHWSNVAYEECKRLNFSGVEVHLVVPPPKGMATDIPSEDEWSFSDDAAYCFICSNETIEGVQFKEFPRAPVPLVIDMSSDFLARPIEDWSNIGCIFAAAQKNFGIAGMSVVIVRSEWLMRQLKPFCPLTLDYRTQAKCLSMYNTPPVFPIYVASVVFKWIEEQGGVEVLQTVNREKAVKLYEAIHRSVWFENRVQINVRSDMNIPFFRKASRRRDDKIDGLFVSFCEKRGIVNLQGFRTVGGYRASIYNAMPMEGVEALVKAIEDFPGFREGTEN
jgi:phosphoserine aminotransferase